MKFEGFFWLIGWYCGAGLTIYLVSSFVPVRDGFGLACWMGTGSSTETFGFSSPKHSVMSELEDEEDDENDEDADDELDRCRLLLGVWQFLVASPSAVNVLTRAISGVVKLPRTFFTSVIHLGFDMYNGSPCVTIL